MGGEVPCKSDRAINFQEARLAWESSQRRESLPSNWSQIRKRILKRDGDRCTASMRDGSRCPTTTGLEVHHTGKANDHREHLLTVLCSWHHAKETAEQSRKAKAIQRSKIRNKFRWSEEHPSMM